MSRTGGQRIEAHEQQQKKLQKHFLRKFEYFSSKKLRIGIRTRFHFGSAVFRDLTVVLQLLNRRQQVEQTFTDPTFVKIDQK